MKKFLSVIVVVLGAFLFVDNVYAIMFDLEISGQERGVVGNTIQLTGTCVTYNDVEDPSIPIGEVNREDCTNALDWSSSDENVAIVNASGKVTLLSEGSVTIYAEDDVNKEKFEIKVSKPTIFFQILDGGGHLVLNRKTETITLYLSGIPDSERENIKFVVKNENVAKISDIDYPTEGMVSIKLDLLAVGDLTITATLDYNGEKYTDVYENVVKETACYIDFSSSGNGTLPKEILVGDKVQLEAIQYCGIVVPATVTNEVKWTSSDEKIATVKNGLVTAKKAGKVTITATYNNDDLSEVNTESYEFEVKGKNKEDNPNTGAFASFTVSLLIILTIVLVLLKIRKDKFLSIN